MLILLSSVAPAEKVDTGKAPSIPDPPAEDTHDYSAYTGRMQWSWGWSTSAGDHLCELYWDTSNIRPARCTECTWSFAVEFTYDEAASYDGGDCLSTLESPDFTWSMGLIEDYYGYGVTTVAVYNPIYGFWGAAFPAAWTPPTIKFGAGYLEDSYNYNGADYYYTNYWYGTATVE